jgi:hypothetical protein
VLVAASVIVTALLVPVVTVWWARRTGPVSLPAGAGLSSPGPTTAPRSPGDRPST